MPHSSDYCERIYAELRRVMSSPEFHASDRNRRFLEYIIDETLAGRDGRIKAYNIATSVFGRNVWFDPQRDPIVRIEAGRLRRSLERFYLTDGKLSTLRIVVPKGGYVPQFQDNIEVSVALETSLNANVEYTAELQPGIFIAPFEFEGSAQRHQSFGIGFARDLMVALSHYPEFTITGLSGNLPTLRQLDMLDPAGPDYLLTGGIAVQCGVIDVKAILFNKAQRVLWSKHCQCQQKAGDLLKARNELALNLARDLGHPFGIIYKDAGRRAAKDGSSFSTPFQFFTRYYEYRRNYDRALFADLRSGLEHLAIANPGDAGIAACLSQIYVDGFRFGFARSEPPALMLNRARVLAHRAIEIEPRSSRAHQALAAIRWLDRECDESFDILEDGLACDPYSTEILADIALYRCLKAHWNKAIPIFEELHKTESPLSLSFQTGLSLYHFASGRFDLALTAARRIEAPHVSHGYVVQAIALIRLGRAEEARHAINQISKLNPNLTLSNPLADLSGDNLDPALSQAVAGALSDAGFSEVFGEEASGFTRRAANA